VDIAKLNKGLHFGVSVERGKEEACSELSRLIMQMSQNDDRNHSKSVAFTQHTVNERRDAYSLVLALVACNDISSSGIPCSLSMQSFISPLASIREQSHCVGESDSAQAVPTILPSE
jgi:hypothetical protein